MSFLYQIEQRQQALQNRKAPQDGKVEVNKTTLSLTEQERLADQRAKEAETQVTEEGMQTAVTNSRSEQRRVAAMNGEPAPVFSQKGTKRSNKHTSPSGDVKTLAVKAPLDIHTRIEAVAKTNAVPKNVVHLACLRAGLIEVEATGILSKD